EDFVRNMIAGVGSIDLALLVVAADDGWMPQTEEHLQILTYLGVERAVVALTKTDLGGNETVIRQIRDRLHDSPFANAQIIAISVRNGDGIDTLKTTLPGALAMGTGLTRLKAHLPASSALCTHRATTESHACLSTACLPCVESAPSSR